MTGGGEGGQRPPFAKRGASLAEMLVAAGLFALVISLFFPIWSITHRAWRLADRFQAVQRDDLTVVFRLRHDYLTSKPGSLVVVPGEPLTLSFLSYEAGVGEEPMWDSTGQVLWRKWVAYRYQPDKGTVMRSELPVPSPGPGSPGPNPDWSAYPTPNVLAHSIYAFDIPSPLPANSLLVVEVTAQRGDALSRNRLSVIPGLYGTDAAGN